GWIVFEPSAIRPRPDRQPGAPTATGGDDTAARSQVDADGDFPEDTGRGAGPSVTLGAPAPLLTEALAGLALVVILAGLARAWCARLWERGLTGETTTRRRYGQALRLLAWSGQPI